MEPRPMSLVLAIDPGTVASGVVIWDGARVHFSEAKVPNEDALRMAGHAEWATTVAIETMETSYGSRLGKETMQTLLWAGRFWEAAARSRSEDRVVLMPRGEVKSYIAVRKANDADIRHALIERLGAPGLKASPGITYGVKGDAWQALALAVTVRDGHR